MVVMMIRLTAVDDGRHRNVNANTVGIALTANSLRPEPRGLSRSPVAMRAQEGEQDRGVSIVRLCSVTPVTRIPWRRRRRRRFHFFLIPVHVCFPLASPRRPVQRNTLTCYLIVGTLYSRKILWIPRRFRRTSGFRPTRPLLFSSR